MTRRAHRIRESERRIDRLQRVMSTTLLIGGGGSVVCKSSDLLEKTEDKLNAISEEIDAERKRLANLKDEMSAIDYVYIKLTGGFTGDFR